MKSNLKALFLGLALLCLTHASLWAQSAAESEDRDFIRNLFQDQKYDFALEEAKSYQHNYPKGFFTHEVLYIKGQIFIQKNREDKALEEFQSLQKNYPKSPYLPDSLYYSAVILIRQGKIEEGAKQLEQLKTKFPESEYLKKASFAQGEIALAKGEYHSAKLYYEKVYLDENEAKDIRLAALHQMSWAQLKAGQVEEAKANFRKLMRSEIKTAEKAKLALELGKLELNAQRYPQAREWLEQQLKDFPHPEIDTQSRFWWAESVTMEQQRTGKAEEKLIQLALKYYAKNLRDAKPLEPELSLLHQGWLHAEAGQTQEAQQDFTELQRQSSHYQKDPILNLLRADLYQKSKDLEKANHHLLKALWNHQGVVEVEEIRFRVVENAFFMGQCETATEQGRPLKQLADPQRHQSLHYYLGSCHFKLNDPTQALLHYKEVPLGGPYGTKFFAAKLKALQDLKRTKEAAQWIEEAWALKLALDWENLLRTKAQLFTELGEWPRVLESYQALIASSPQTKGNPWIMVEWAKAEEALAEPSTNQRFRSFENVKDPKQHQANALLAYEAAFQAFAPEEARFRLSMLEHRRRLHLALGQFPEVAQRYTEAIPLLENPEQQASLILELARFRIATLNDKEKAKADLLKIHGKAAKEPNLQGSLLLAELWIEEQNYSKAVDVITQIEPDLKEGSEVYFQAHFRKAELLQQQENWKPALQSYRKVSDAFGKSPLKAQAKKRSAEIEAYLRSLKR